MPNIKKQMIGKRFGRLTVLLELESDPKFIKYLCRCDCSKEIAALGAKLRSGDKKSCGCLQTESAKSKLGKMTQVSTKYSKLESLQISIWRRLYKDGDISFEDFLHLSSLDCYYCGSAPSNKRTSGAVIFEYNGLDRVDSNQPHNLSNSVPACIICNRGKSNRNIVDAVAWMKNLSSNFRTDKDIILNSLPFPEGDEQSFVKTLFRNIRHKGTDLSLEDFYNLSKGNCHYCGSEPSNRYGSFQYSGLDRKDSSIKYLRSNVVPSCKYCNLAKGNLTINQFENWIRRLGIKNRF